MRFIAYIIILYAFGVVSLALKTKFEKVLPIGFALIVLIEYFFGLIGYLKTGAYFAIFIAAIIYVILIINRKRYDYRYVKNGTIYFLLLVVLLLIGCYGKLIDNWDEFSHWGYVVKEMFLIDDFSTSQYSNALFPSYPPGMALFQYFGQKVYQFFGSGENVEWISNFAYKLFVYSFFLPVFCLLEENNKKKIGKMVLFFLLFSLMGMYWEGSFFHWIMIDPALGLIFGAGILRIFWEKDKDLFYYLYILAVIFILPLIKTAGIFLSICLALLHIIDEFSKGRKMAPAKMVGDLIACFLAIYPWNYHIKAHHAINDLKESNNAYDIENLWLCMIGRQVDYRMDVWNHFWDGFCHEKIQLVYFNIPHVVLAIFLIAANIILLLYLKYKRKISRGHVVVWGSFFVMLSSVYIIGLCTTYMDRLTKEMGLSLASFSRYMSILYCALSTFLLFSLLFTICREKNIRYRKIEYTVFAIIFLMIVPIKAEYVFLTRGFVRESEEFRKRFYVLEKFMKEYTDNDTNVFLVSYGSTGLPWYVYRYVLMPNNPNINDGDALSLSIGINKAFDGDKYTHNPTEKEWMDLLCDKYDYVAIQKMEGPYFIEYYRDCFENDSDIEDGGFYRVDTQSRKLIKCK